MRAVLTLAWKDMRNLLTSPLFYIISGFCTVVWTYSYLRNILSFAEKAARNMQPGADPAMNLQREVFLIHISQANLLFVFLLPALTMRLLSEEKRLRTYDLLLTSPISATQIALGKFLACLGAVGVLTFISLLYPLSTRMVAAFPLAPLLSAYLGLLLVSAGYVSVGLFASSLTESVLLSVFLGFVFNILIWFLPQGASDSMPMLSSVLEYMSLGQHFLNFIMGAVKLNSLVFLLSITGLFVFLTQRVIESSRWR